MSVNVVPYVIIRTHVVHDKHVLLLNEIEKDYACLVPCKQVEPLST